MLEVHVGHGSFGVAQRQLSAIEHILLTILQEIKADGSFSATASRQVTGSPNQQGKLRIGIYDVAKRLVKLQHQIGDNNTCFEFQMHVPGLHDMDRFYQAFTEGAGKMSGVIVGTKVASTNIPTGESTTPPPQPPAPQPPTSNPAKSPRKKAILSLRDKKTVGEFMSCLSAEVHSQNGLVTRAQINKVMADLFSIVSGLDIGQKIRRFKQGGELEDLGDGSYRIIKFTEYRRGKSAPAGGTVAPLAGVDLGSTPPPLAVANATASVTANATATVPTGSTQTLRSPAYPEVNELATKLVDRVKQLERDKAAIDAEIVKINAFLVSAAQFIGPSSSR